MKYFVFFMICEILIVYLTADKCETPNHSSGVCIPLRQCYALLEYLEAEPTSEEVKQFYENSICGVKNKTNPYVCCGRDSHFIRTKIEAEKNMIDRNLQSSPITCGDIRDENIYKGIRLHWNALLQYRTASGDLVFACGGSIITKRYILTAAHCVSGDIINSVGELVSVRLGEHNMSTETNCLLEDNCPDPVLNIPVETVASHAEYVEEIKNRRHDIALVRLSEDIAFSAFVQPLCLPYSDTKNSSYFILSGWGITPKGKKTDSKQEIGLFSCLLSTEKCNDLLKFYNATVTDDHMCIEDSPTDQDSCYLESGGSLMTISVFDNNVHCEGISSMRRNCVNKTVPHVFTNVRNYIPWILENVKP